MLWLCATCGAELDPRKGEVEGSMKFPQCKECYKKNFNNDDYKYMAFLATGVLSVPVRRYAVAGSIGGWIKTILSALLEIYIVMPLAVIILSVQFAKEFWRDTKEYLRKVKSKVDNVIRLVSILPVLRGFLLALAVVFLVGQIMTSYAAREYLTLGLSRVEVYREHDLYGVSTDLIGIEDELEMFRAELHPLIDGKTGSFGTALTIKEWVMNQAGEVGSAVGAATPYGILVEMREGKGASCASMALLYFASLKSVGMEARLVQLVRGVYSGSDSHMVVEVLADGDWVVVDPTFNCYFVVDGKPASALDLHRLLLRNERPKNVEVVPGAEVAYPAALEEYYIDPLTLYNNVFVVKRLNYGAPRWSIIVPWYRYYSGFSYVAVDEKGDVAHSELRLHQYLVIAHDFVFPIGIAVSLIAFVATFCRVHKIWRLWSENP